MIFNLLCAYIQVIAENLSEEEIAGLKEMFKMMDTDNSGQINFEELKAGLQRVGANMKEPEIYQLMQAVSLLCLISSLRQTCMDKEAGEFSSISAETKLHSEENADYFNCSRNNSCSNALLACLQADIDNSGTIDYGEFIAATLHLNKVEREDHLFAAFQYFDKDGSGYITADELQQACDEFGIEDVRLEDMIGEVDQDNVWIHDYPILKSPLSPGVCIRQHNPDTLLFDPSAGWAHRLQ